MRRRIAGVALVALALVLQAAGVSAGAAPIQLQLKAPDGKVSWLSAGDSYASGEGASGAAGECQRTTAAWGPRTARIMREQRAWTVEPDDFTACTGAKTAQVPKPKQPYDVITLSTGGNDIDFSGTIKDCLATPDTTGQWIDVIEGANPDGRCQVTESELRRRIDNALTGSSGLVAFWRKTAQESLTQKGVLLVAGYPRVATPSSDWGAWRGERCNTIHRDDADMLGRAAEYFDRRMKEEIDILRGSGLRIEYASRLAVFDAGGDYHSLCARGVEWLNTIFLFLRTTGRVENGFHPNDLGHLATAEHAAALVEQALGVRPPAPTTVPTRSTAQPTISSGQSTYKVGSTFQGTCTVAWPTAPARGRNNIQMRMTCPGVPDQFLFVDVIYGDPDLPVSPSRSTVQIRGKIADISRSEYGFTVLVVQADRATVL